MAWYPLSVPRVYDTLQINSNVPFRDFLNAPRSRPTLEHGQIREQCLDQSAVVEHLVILLAHLAKSCLDAFRSRCHRLLRPVFVSAVLSLLVHAPQLNTYFDQILLLRYSRRYFSCVRISIHLQRHRLNPHPFGRVLQYSYHPDI